METTMERIKAGTSSAYSNKKTYALFDRGVPFYGAFFTVVNQNWGGKVAPQLQRLAKAVQLAYSDFGEIVDRYIKELGKPSGAGYSMEGASSENAKEYYEAVEELKTSEIILPSDLELPIKLIKRKKNQVTPMQAAAIEGFLEIKWNEEDDGSDLDKDDRK